jgi:peptidoglycan-N-acetylglucosamine deacetylase
MAYPGHPGSYQGVMPLKILAWARFSVVILCLASSLAWGGEGLGASAGAGPICRGTTTHKRVALTFDDGPHHRFTPDILNLLDTYQAQATFFVLGRHAARYPHVMRELVKSGHELGNHSFSHLRFPAANREAWLREMKRTELELELLGCPDLPLFRPPYSDFNQGLVNFLANLHRRLVLWSVDSADWREPDPLAIAANVLSRVKPGDIVIFHDSDETGTVDRRPTVEALGLILPALKARGYEFVTVSEILSPPSVDRTANPQERRNCSGLGDKVK